jgi:hypothetical protein
MILDQELGGAGPAEARQDDLLERVGEDYYRPRSTTTYVPCSAWKAWLCSLRHADLMRDVAAGARFAHVTLATAILCLAEYIAYNAYMKWTTFPTMIARHLALTSMLRNSPEAMIVPASRGEWSS